MDEIDYKIWIHKLPTLTKQQVNDVSNRIKILSFASGKEFTGKQDFGARVSEAICATFRKLGVECPSPNTLRKSAAYAHSKDKFDDLASFFEKVSQQRLVQDAVLVIGIEQLYNSMLSWGHPISSHTVLNHIHRVPAALNKAFPGYAQVGLLTRLVKHESSGK